MKERIQQKVSLRAHKLKQKSCQIDKLLDLLRRKELVAIAGF